MNLANYKIYLVFVIVTCKINFVIFRTSILSAVGSMMIQAAETKTCQLMMWFECLGITTSPVHSGLLEHPS